MHLRPPTLRTDLHAILQRLLTTHLPPDAVVYDVGCGEKPFAPFLKGKVKAHIGVDLADGFYRPDQVDIIGTAYCVPAPDGCADAVISSQVIEHLETPLVAIDEAHRLLKPGGLLFLSFPFLYPIHAPPRDYLRYTEFYLSNEIGGDRFEVVTLERIGGFWYVSGMYFGLYMQHFAAADKFRILRAVSFLIGVCLQALHAAEVMVLRLAGKDPSQFRSPWTVNYVGVLKKTR